MPEEVHLGTCVRPCMCGRVRDLSAPLGGMGEGDVFALPFQRVDHAFSFLGEQSNNVLLCKKELFMLSCVKNNIY